MVYLFSELVLGNRAKEVNIPYLILQALVQFEMAGVEVANSVVLRSTA